MMIPRGRRRNPRGCRKDLAPQETTNFRNRRVLQCWPAARISLDITAAGRSNSLKRNVYCCGIRQRGNEASWSRQGENSTEADIAKHDVIDCHAEFS